jgi:hypothetical protein
MELVRAAFCARHLLCAHLPLSLVLRNLVEIGAEERVERLVVRSNLGEGPGIAVAAAAAAARALLLLRTWCAA